MFRQCAVWALVLAACGGGGGMSDATIDLGIISQSAASVREAESTVAVASDGRVVVAWIGLEQAGGAHIGYAFSHDRGTTFGPLQQLVAPGGQPSRTAVAVRGKRSPSCRSRAARPRPPDSAPRQADLFDGRRHGERLGR